MSLRVQDHERVRLLTLDRPEARNAINAELRRELVRALRQADEDPAVAVVVLTGTDPAFSGGVDIRESTDPGQPLRPERLNPAQAVRGMTTPVISAVNGACYTGALELALSCSFVVASERASFADTHASLGLIPGWGLSALLPRAVGVRLARQMMLTGEPISAATALAAGLANEVVPHTSLLTRVLDLAGSMAQADERAVGETLRLLAAGEGATTAHALGLEAEAAARWRVSAPELRSTFESRLDRGPD